jgi:hypothetical protein
MGKRGAQAVFEIHRCKVVLELGHIGERRRFAPKSIPTGMKFSIAQEAQRHVLAALLLLAGYAFLHRYFSVDEIEKQPVDMLYAGIALVATGILSIPAVLNMLNVWAYRGLLVVGLAFAGWLTYGVFFSIDEEVQFMETKARVDAETIQRLKDIRDMEEAYRSVRGAYTANPDSLLAFIQEENLPVAFNMGSFHDTLSEEASRKAGYVLKRSDVARVGAKFGYTEEQFLDMISMDKVVYKVRDNVFTSYFSENLTPEKRQEKRLPPVSLDSLWFNPLTGERFIIKTGTVENGGVTQPTVLCQDPTPFGREGIKKDTLRFGSLSESHTDGNWRNN